MQAPSTSGSFCRSQSKIEGRGTIPDTKSYVIEHPAGRDWRYFHEVALYWIGGVAVIGMLVLLVVFYLIRGMVRIQSGRSGRTLVRFNAIERFVDGDLLHHSCGLPGNRGGTSAG
jgi:formate dehydrogenase subunit gamma